MQPSPQQIKETLEALGYRLTDIGESWQTNALYRGGDNPTALAIYKTSGVWSDFVTGEKAQPFEKLVRLSGGTGISAAPSDEPIVKYIDEEDRNQSQRTFPDSMLDRLMPHYRFYTDKNVSVQVLKRLKSGAAFSGKMYGRYVFPILSFEQKIIGFAGRDMTADAKKPKWKLIGHKKNWIYPLFFKDEMGEFFVQDSIKKSGEVIIVESIGDCLSLNSRGIYNVLVAFGLKISDAIIAKLVEFAPSKIIIAFNNDFAKDFNSGRNSAIENYLSLLQFFDIENLAICLPLANDFSDHSDQQHKDWLKKKETFDFQRQRDYICENVEKFIDDGWINKKSQKYIKYLDCP